MGKMTDNAISVLFENGKKVFKGELELNEAVQAAHELCPEVATSSARHYINWYSKMREGEILTWNSNSKLLLYYAKKILEEEGRNEGEKAIESVKQFAIRMGRSDLEHEVQLLLPPEDIDSDDMTTKEIIDKIEYFISANGFTYSNGLIENFFLSLKSKPFVILAGTSGTGKTKLVSLFSEAIGAKMQLVPVRPDWSDSSDLFGHVDLSGKFVPGEIIDFIKQASENLDIPHIICLDEMNLARVEYYLSDFLSIIETRRFNDGRIITNPLLSKEKYGIENGAYDHYGELYLPENLYIVGTVNMDETTFPFSKKVLDRANTIEFSYVDLTPDFTGYNEAAERLSLENSFLKTEYLKLAACSDEADFIDEICSELQDINKILQKANAHVGYRVRDEIVFYMLNNKKAELLDRDIAMDNEIMQKILPRIQGSSNAVKDMLCDLFKMFCSDYRAHQTAGSDLFEQMQQAINVGAKYPESAKKVAFMVRRFDEDGFTSYWL